MTNAALQDDWEAYQKQAQSWIRLNLPRLLEGALADLDQYSNEPSILGQHVAHILHLLNRARFHTEFYPMCIELVSRLGVLPTRFGYWVEWTEELQFAADMAEKLYRYDDQARFLNILADISLLRGELEIARAASEQAYRIARMIKSPSILMTAIAGMVSALRFQRQFDAANTLIDNLTDEPLIQQAKGTTQSIVFAQMMNLRAIQARHEGKLQQAHDYASAAVDYMAAYPDAEPALLAHLYRMRGLSSWILGSYRPAAQDLRRSAQLFKACSDTFSQSWAIGNLGLVYWSMGWLKRAEAATRYSIQVARDFNATLQLVSQIGNLALVYLSQGRLDKADHLLRRQINLAQRFHIPGERLRGCANRGVLYLHKGDYALALPDLQAELVVLEKQPPTDGLANLYINLSRCFWHLGEKEQAISYVRRAIAIGHDMNSLPIQILALRCAAEYGIDNPLKSLKRAIKLSKQCPRYLDLAACYLSLAGYRKDPLLWSKGEHLLREIGADAWLTNSGMDQIPEILTLA